MPGFTKPLDNPVRALVLSGGGSLGAFQVGALDVLVREQSREYDVLCGVSVGALNAAFLAQSPKGELGAGVEALMQLWRSLKTSDVRQSWRWGEVSALWKTSVYNSAPLQKLVRSKLDVEKVRASGRTVRVGAVSWQSGAYRAAGETDQHFQEWVLASSSFPSFFCPVSIHHELWTDGGVRHVTPLGDAIRLGASEIDVVMCAAAETPAWVPPKKGTIPFMLRAIEMMTQEIIENDLRIAGLKNDLAQTRPEYRAVKIQVVRPREPLAGDALTFEPKVSARRIELGRLAALSVG